MECRHDWNSESNASKWTNSIVAEGNSSRPKKKPMEGWMKRKYGAENREEVGKVATNLQFLMKQVDRRADYCL